MIDPDLITIVARTWLDTPFRHNQRSRGRGVDCWNLIRAVSEEIGSVKITNEDFKPFEGYRRVPARGQLTRALDKFFIRRNSVDPRPGDIALLRRGMDDDAKHCGIVLQYKGRLTIIHAAMKYGGCVEHTLTGEWRDKIKVLYRFP